MVTTQDYATLSSRVYFRTDKNRSPIPNGWKEEQYQGNVNASGFSAGVYRSTTTNEIVIAYTGTNEQKVVDFTSGNIPAPAEFTSGCGW